MQKVILPIIIFLLLFGVVSPLGIPLVSYGVNFAQEAELPKPGLTPDSLFYFLDILGEKIGMFFTFGAEKKAKKALKYAEEKMAEIKAMAEKNKIKALEKANQKYEEYLNLIREKGEEAYKKGIDVEKLAILVNEKTLKHLEILSNVYEKVPGQAQEGLEKAMEMSQKAFKETIRVLTQEGREEALERFRQIPHYVSEEPEARLDFSFSKTEARIGESIEVQLSLKNVGKKPFPEGDYQLIFYLITTGIEEGREAQYYHSIKRFDIKGPIEPRELIEKEVFLLIKEEFKSGTYLFSLSFEKPIPEGSQILKELKKEITLTILPKEEVPKRPEIEKLEIPVIKEKPILKEEKDRALSVCEKIKPERAQPRSQCMALVKKDPSFCEMIGSPDYQKRCYLRVALAAKDSVICTRFEYLEERKLCELIVKRDLTACIIMVTHDDYCYAQIATLKGDASICDLIKYEEYRNTCKALILRDVSFCKGSPTEDCYQKFALLTGDKKACSALEIEATEGLKRVRNLTREVEKCIKMANREVTDCFIEPGTGIDCDSIPAVIADPSLCQQLQLEKDYCQKTYVRPEDIRRCEQEQWHLDMDACYFSVAIRIAELFPLETMLLPSPWW